MERHSTSSELRLSLRYIMELYELEVDQICELLHILNQRAIQLGDAMHLFQSALQEMQRSVPGSFQVYYNVEGDGHEAVRYSL